MFIVLLQNPENEEPWKVYGPFEDEAAAKVCEEKEAEDNNGWANLMEVEPWPTPVKKQQHSPLRGLV